METWLPDLNTSGVADLECLPGTGPARAALIVRERTRLGFPLSPLNLDLLPGIGESYAREIQEWYGRWSPSTEGNPEAERKRNQKAWVRSKLLRR
jgi:hypothetical protein